MSVVYVVFSVIVVGFVDFSLLVPAWFYLAVDTFAIRIHSSLSMSPD
jgi:hypothetical protein